LAIGFALGVSGHGQGGPLDSLVPALSTLGTMWVNALKVTVVPLVASLLVTGIAAMPRERVVGRWVGLSLGTFLAMLLLAAGLAIGAGSLYLPRLGPGALPLPDSVGEPRAAEPQTLSFGGWLESLVPDNALQAAVSGNILPIAVLSILFGLALRQVEASKKQTLVAALEAVRDAVLVFVRWVLLFIPIGAFALAFTFSMKGGPAVAALTLQLILLVSALLIALTLILWLSGALFGKIGLMRFASAALPSQAVALSTRSSIATLPTMVDAAERLELPAPAASLTLPLSVAVFKVNRTLTATLKLLFVATVFGIALDPLRIAAFVMTVVLLSFATPGIPSVGSSMTLGAYMAAGLPAEGVLLFDAAESVTDPLKTVANVTGDLASATIVSRLAGGSTCSTPAPPLPTP
jgi:proton glutamate symport protein